MSASIEGERDSLLTHVNQLTRVNRCARKAERTRVVGLRLPEPLHQAYLDLPDPAKTTIRLVVGALIGALAPRYGIEIECKEFLQHWMQEIPAPPGQIIINANIAEAKAEAKINVDLKELEELKQLLEDLLKLASIEGRGRRILEQRVRKAQALLDRLALN